MGAINLPAFIPTQLQFQFGDDDEEEDGDFDINQLPPNIRNQLPPGVKIQVVPGGAIPPGAIPGGAIPGGAIPGGAVPAGAIPLGGGGLQLGGGNIDPNMLPESIERIKIGSNDFWLLKNGENNPDNIVIGIANRNLIITSKGYAEKYVKFDGKNSLASNKAVAKMMANNPSYLVYSDPKSFASFLDSMGQFTGQPMDEGVKKLFTASDLPILLGVYAKNDVIRVDLNSGLPLPDFGALLIGGSIANQPSDN